MTSTLFHPKSGSIQLPPPPFNGVNTWLLGAARRCYTSGLSAEQAMQEIWRFDGQLRPGRRLHPTEVIRAITRVYEPTTHQYPCQEKTAASCKKSKMLAPKSLDSATLRHLCPPAPVSLLTESSPQSITTPPAGTLRMLFSADDLILTVPQPNYPRQIRKIGTMSNKSLGQFITANPVTGKTGKTQEGRDSYGAKECFQKTRHVVFECDHGSEEEQVGRILYIAQKVENSGHGRLVMVLRSGGKSLHAWIVVPSEESADIIREASVRLSADPATVKRNWFVRCPNVIRRETARIQELLFLNPHPQRIGEL